MKFSSFFITRPIFAIVLSALIVVGGGLALLKLPVSEYPAVVPPTVVVHAAYPGANPKVIAETVAAPLEQQMNGVEGMLYMFSQATSDGALTLTITFALGTDLDNAQVQVHQVQNAEPEVPHSRDFAGFGRFELRRSCRHPSGKSGNGEVPDLTWARSAEECSGRAHGGAVRGRKGRRSDGRRRLRSNYMECLSSSRELSDYLNGRGTEQERREVHRHLSSCPRCADHAEERVRAAVLRLPSARRTRH